MSFVDDLRRARSSRVAVLHEFWTQFDPSKSRLHLFFEAHDDAVFFRRYVGEYVRSTSTIYVYICDGKSKVFDAFEQITSRMPNIRSTLFFVDKDLDDILGIAWPTDPRIFITDVYSIENYCVTRQTIQRFYLDCVRLTGVSFDSEAIFSKFETQLTRFHRRAVPVMAWILQHRRAGMKPNVNNLEMGDVLDLSVDCELRPKGRQRLKVLEKVCGMAPTHFRLSSVAELRRMPAKRIVRGKFEIWFAVEFWKKVSRHLQQLASEAGGKVSFRLSLERSNAIAILTPYTPIPRSLELFLRAHLPNVNTSRFSLEAESTSGAGWLRKAWQLLTRRT